MQYSEARSLIKSGDLIGLSHRGFSSWYDIQIQMVRFFTQSEYSHVGVAWVFGGRVFIIESVTGGVRIFPMSRCNPFYLVRLNVQWTDEAVEFAMAHLGERYSKWEAFKSFFEPLTNNGLWQCAKWADALLEVLGVDLGEVVTPTALMREALRRPGATLTLVE